MNVVITDPRLEVDATVVERFLSDNGMSKEKQAQLTIYLVLGRFTFFVDGFATKKKAYALTKGRYGPKYCNKVLTHELGHILDGKIVTWQDLVWFVLGILFTIGWVHFLVPHLIQGWLAFPLQLIPVILIFLFPYYAKLNPKEKAASQYMEQAANYLMVRKKPVEGGDQE